MRVVQSSLVAVLLLSVGCAGTTSSTKPTTAPGASAGGATNAAVAKEDPFAIPKDLAQETFLPVPTVPPPERLFGAEAQRGVAPAPASCGPLKKPAAPKVKVSCSQSVLDAVVLEPVERDRTLFALEACPGAGGALATVLRADFAPRECADVVLEPSLGKLDDRGASPSLVHGAWGLVLAAKLSRTVTAPPKLDGAATKEAIVKYMQTALRPWFVEQARSIDDLAARAAKIDRYGRAVSAVEAALADARFVEAARSAPIPDAWKNDEELKTVYYAALDEVLEPRKVRARSAALEALKHFADIGVLHDDRLDRARALVGKMYAGRRIDALDGLLLATPAIESNGAFARLPTFYVDEVLATKKTWTDAELTDMLVRGVPTTIRRDSRPIEDVKTRSALAQARVALAAKYWRSSFADAAIPVLAAEKGNRTTLALALALHSGPDDANALVAGSAQQKLRPFDTRALDALAASADRPVAAASAYNAGVFARAVIPADADAAYFEAVAKRFHRAEELFDGAKERAAAQAQARELLETARAVSKK